MGADARGQRGERRYRKGEDVKNRLDTLASPDAAVRVALLVREAPFGMGMADLVARTGMQETQIRVAAAKAALVTIGQPQPWYVDRAWMQATRERLVKIVQEFHRKHPLLPGIARQDLRGRELQDAPAFVLDALLADAKELAPEGETVRARGHKLVLKQDEEQAEAREGRHGGPPLG